MQLLLPKAHYLDGPYMEKFSVPLTSTGLPTKNDGFFCLFENKRTVSIGRRGTCRAEPLLQETREVTLR